MPAPRYRLRLSKLEFVSPVDQPAQETAKVLLFKRSGALTATAHVAKVADDLGLVFLWAFTSTLPDGAAYHDLQGDTIDQDFIKAAAEFMTSGGPTDEMHDSKATGRVVFAMPMTPEIAKAYGVETKTTGLMVAIKPPADVLAKFKSGEYTGVSIAGTGIRELMKSAPACPSCGAYGKADDATCAKCGKAMKRAPVVKSAWTTADIDGLPDSSFLYVEGGGKTDSDGKTTPRSLRHFPYRDATGKVDLPHLRDAIGRIPQSSLPKERRDSLQVKAEKLLGKQHDATKRFAKQATLTGSVDGHQHSLDLDDPADEWRDTLSTSYQTSEGADQSHCHAWTFDATTGKITIADDSGHTHPVEDIVPDDVRAQAALQESGERCPKCAAMCDEGCRYCPACGASMDRRDGVPDGDASDDDSGPSVVIVAARAPESPPSSAANTVKSATKEPIAMPDLNDKIKELEASNARLSKLASLTDAQRAHHGKLGGTDAEAFLAKSAHERDVVLSDIAKADEVVYKSPHTGREFRKSHPLEMIEMAKQLDEATTVAKSSAARETEMTFAKRGDETIGVFAKGAKGNLRGRIMKALNAEFTDPAEYEEAVKAMKSANAALKDLGVAKGVNPHTDAGDGPQTVQAKLDALATEYAQKNNVPLRKAAAAILETAAGAELYAQLPVGRA